MTEVQDHAELAVSVVVWVTESLGNWPSLE